MRPLLHAIMDCKVLVQSGMRPNGKQQQCSIKEPCHAMMFLSSIRRLSAIDEVFRCPALEHVGLAFNNVRLLPPAAAITGNNSIISLDLSDNDLASLDSICSKLATLPQLRNLSLKGNPMCLLPSYYRTCRNTLVDLTHFDGMVSAYGMFVCLLCFPVD